MNKHRGVTLMEVLVALTLVSVAILGLAKLQVRVKHEAAHATSSMAALNLAEQSLELLRARSANGAISWSDFAGFESGSESVRYAPYSLEWQVMSVATHSEVELKRVLITVSWVSQSGQAQSLSLLTMLSNRAEGSSGP
ncbi:prepilin-type N-terminal cleavage/methylation domain-containing protein [Vibrio sp. JPW-9-11-11]|uniref:type IV pilus modification PilV family protein n=1 Tax=Vibrio sp. JPW-9-11-11 TaxID=1416532 RepID=UPI001594590B|nr:prepilin-type N-terminal cleavage/methylation domain-containing protein [Vibrio sp. JPW-9-11-11]